MPTKIIPIINDASTNKFNLLEGVALNATAATRTITIPISPTTKVQRDGAAKLIVVVKFTYAAATTVTATPTGSMDGGTTYASETSTAIAAGAGTVSLYVDTYTTSGASAIFTLYYDVSGRTDYKIVFGGASAGASDLVNVQATLQVES